MLRPVHACHRSTPLEAANSDQRLRVAHCLTNTSHRTVNTHAPPPHMHPQVGEFKYALVWGTSSKHYPQRCGLSHPLEDEDVVQVGLCFSWVSINVRVGHLAEALPAAQPPTSTSCGLMRACTTKRVC